MVTYALVAVCVTCICFYISRTHESQPDPEIGEDGQLFIDVVVSMFVGAFWPLLIPVLVIHLVVRKVNPSDL